MRQYKKYKPSGIEWIGNIPEHWIIDKFSRIAFYQEGPGLRHWQFAERGIKVICVTNITEKGINFSLLEKFISEEEYKNYKHFTVNKGDYLLASSGASWGKVAEFKDEESVILNTSTIRFNTINSKKCNKDLIKWIIKSPYAKEHLNILLTGSCQPNFGPSHLNQLVVVYPPDIKEQQAIATYLDEKSAQIDTLIRNKQKLIELLKEEKAALINEAVTKGINPHVPLKPSGIEWLGDIPEHWEVKKLKYVVSKVGSGITPSGGASVYQTEGIPLLRSQNIHFDGLRLEDVAYITEEIDESMKNSRVNVGDVLLNITGASIGRCYYLNETFGRGNVNQHVCIIRPIQTYITTKFLYYLLRSNLGQLQIDLLQTGANREGLNFEQLRNFNLLIPEITEQDSITDYLEHETGRTDYTIIRIEKEIELMQEYRTALISEVVTGQVKVVD